MSRPCLVICEGLLTAIVDANLFKDAFIKAQSENEELFKKEGGDAKPEEAPAPAA